MSLEDVLANVSRTVRTREAFTNIDTKKVWYKREVVVSLCAHVYGWAVDDELTFLTIAPNVHFLLNSRPSVHCLTMLSLRAQCYLSAKLANVLYCVTC